MLSKRSIRGEYTRQIIISFCVFLIAFGAILYSYLHYSTYEGIRNDLRDIAIHISKNNIHYPSNSTFYIQNANILQKDTLKLSVLDTPINESSYAIEEGRFVFLTPYEKKKTLQITKDISKEQNFLERLLKGIVLVVLFTLVLVQLFALAFSNILYKPIQKLSSTLEKVKESNLELLDDKELPLEFQPLVFSINNLLGRIKNYLASQKQLFIGIAHELKTPLAVIKTKCEVTLIKEREKEVYIQALRENIESINEMNAIIKMLLEVGRQESAQFEKSSLVDVYGVLRNIANNFKVLSAKEHKRFVTEISDEKLLVMIQPTLLTQIVQNFLQNAFKFTPENKSVFLKSFVNDGILKIIVIDEGCGIDSEIDDIYAPFKRAGNKSGAGLGLFLAKNAANALGGRISLQNRLDGEGTIASFEIDISKIQHQGS